MGNENKSNGTISFRVVYDLREIILFTILFATNIGMAIYFNTVSIAVTGIICNILLVYGMGKIDYQDMISVLIIVMINYIVMLVLYFGYLDFYGEPYYLGGSDDLQFEKYANILLEKGLPTYSQADHLLTYTYNRSVGNGFVYVISILIYLCNKVGGYHTLVFRIINIHVLIMGICLLIQSVELYNKKNNNNKSINKTKCLFIIAVFPSIMYVAVHVFRDTLVFFLFTVIIYDVISKSRWIVIRGILVCMMMFLLRPEYLVCVVGIYVVFFFIKQNTLWKKSLIVLAGLIILVIAFSKLNIISVLTKKMIIYDSSLGSDDGFGAMVFQIPIFPLGIFVRIVYALITPLPHLIFIHELDIESIISFVRAIGTWYFIFMIPYWVRSLLRKSVWSWISLGFLTMICMITFTFRHFIIFFPFALIAALEETERTEVYTKKMYALLSFSCIAFYLIAYYAIK